MSGDNGERWYWISAFLEGFGPVFFEARRTERPAAGAVLVRNLTACQIGPSQKEPGKMLVAFTRHPLFAGQVYGESVELSASAIVLWAPAPPPVAEVCTKEWQPRRVIAEAKPADADALAGTLRKLREGDRN